MKKAGTVTKLFKWIGHLLTTAIIKTAKSISLFKKKINEYIRVKIVIILNFQDGKVVFIVFYVKDVNKIVP